MAQKRNEENGFVAEVEEGFTGDDTLGEAKFDADFDLESEYKAPPLIPQGVYSANVIDTKFDAEAQTIIWTFTLVDNGGVLSDGETSVDGVQLTATNWLPKVGDENELTKTGKMTKRQAKVNMLFYFLKDMGCPEKTSAEINRALNNKDWVGKRAKLTVGVRTYEGRLFNEVKKAVAV
jgi:hypothetical protein